MALSSLAHRAGIAAAAGVFSVGLVSSVSAGDRPGVVTPFGSVMPIDNTEPGGGLFGLRGGIVDLQAAADHIVAQQCMDGGWGWPHDDCGATYNNITAPIATGVLRAYASTQDPAHLASAVAGGDFDLTFVYPNMTPRFGAFTAPFLNELSEVTGDPSYANHAATWFYGALDAGTYGDTGSNWSTADWINAVQTGGGRDGVWINLRPWEFHHHMATAAELGTPGQVALFLAATLDGLNTLDNTDPFNVYSDIIGLAGGIRGLGLSGTTSFAPIASPLHPLINGIDNLTDLANVLVSLQNPDGSWNWHSNLPSPALDDEDTQTSAYAVLALIAAQQAGAGDYTDAIALGRQWLGTMQTGSGEFLSYPGGTANTEVEGEATTALASTATLGLNTTTCENSGILTVTIDMSDTAVDVVGGQFFLSYDNSVLDFMSADVVAGGTFPTEVFEFVDEVAGTIDYAVGVSVGASTGTHSAETMAVLTFGVLAENCTDVASLVSFRGNTPPSRLTDDLGNPVLPMLIDLNGVAFDETPPVVTPPADITLNADAGGCDAAVTVPALVATDNCGIASIVNDFNGTADASGVYPQGTTTVTWTVTDTCGNTTVVSQDITVNAFNSLSVTVELANVSDSMDRCITFEIEPTGNGTPVIIEQTLSFAAGVATATFDIPCGDYDCITARDTLHTLRSRDDDDFGVSGTIYTADFTSAGDGDALIGGNFNDDQFIDILDFGIFIGQFGTDPGVAGGDTVCGTTGPDADASGNGTVGTEDFTFIQTQFLFMSEPSCASTLLTTGGGNRAVSIDAARIEEPVVSITLEELDARGLGHLAGADLNGDGVLDPADIAAFFAGARPDHLADLNGDGVVNIDDLGVLHRAMTSGDPAGDVNRDGTLDLADIVFVLERMGMTFGG